MVTIEDLIDVRNRAVRKWELLKGEEYYDDRVVIDERGNIEVCYNATTCGCYSSEWECTEMSFDELFMDDAEWLEMRHERIREWDEAVRRRQEEEARRAEEKALEKRHALYEELRKEFEGDDNDDV